MEFSKNIYYSSFSSNIPFGRRFLEARTPALGIGETLVLDHGKILLLPTRLGLGFGLLLALLLVVGLNYDNNLTLFLAFLLIGLGIHALLACWRQLHGLRITAEVPEPAFVGKRVRFPLRCSAPAPLRRLRLEHEESPPICMDLEPDRSIRVFLELPAHRRGRRPAGQVRILSTYPLGLFRAWSRLRLRGSALAWPKPADVPLPLPFESGPDRPEGVWRGDAGDPEDFAGHRPWRRGDPLRAVDWKALAREQGMLAKVFTGGDRQECWLDLQNAPERELEACLSRLCAWLLDAERRGISTGLRLPGTLIPPGTGTQHRLRCLEALALHGEGTEDD